MKFGKRAMVAAILLGASQMTAFAHQTFPAPVARLVLRPVNLVRYLNTPTGRVRTHIKMMLPELQADSVSIDRISANNAP